MLGITRSKSGQFTSSVEKLEAELHGIPGRLAELHAEYQRASFDADADPDGDRSEARRIARTIRELEARQAALPGEIHAARSETEKKAAAEEQRRRDGDARAASQHLGGMGSAVDDACDLLDRLTRVYRRFAEASGSFKQLTGHDLANDFRRQLNNDVALLMAGEAGETVGNLREFWKTGAADRKQAVADIKSPPPPAPPRPPIVDWPGVGKMSADDRHKGRTYLEHLAAYNAEVQERWSAARQRLIDRRDAAHAAGGPVDPASDRFWDGQWYEVPDETARGIYAPDPAFLQWQQKIAGTAEAVAPSPAVASVATLPVPAVISDPELSGEAPTNGPAPSLALSEADERLLYPGRFDGKSHVIVDGKPLDEAPEAAAPVPFTSSDAMAEILESQRKSGFVPTPVDPEPQRF